MIISIDSLLFVTVSPINASPRKISWSGLEYASIEKDVVQVRMLFRGRGWLPTFHLLNVLELPQYLGILCLNTVVCRQ